MIEKNVTRLAYLALFLILVIELIPVWMAVRHSHTWDGFTFMLTSGSSLLSIVTVVGMTIALRWSKTVVATMAAMFALAGLVDFFRYGIEISDIYVESELVWGILFFVVFLCAIISIWSARRPSTSQ